MEHKLWHAVICAVAILMLELFVPAVVAAKTYAITGKVTQRDAKGKNRGVSGVKLDLLGSGLGSTHTKKSGVYKFPGLPNGAYTVTPSKPGCVFNPESRKVTISGKGMSKQNFTAVCDIASLGSSVVTVSGRQLIVEKRKPDGTLGPPAPYIIKGALWSP